MKQHLPIFGHRKVTISLLEAFCHVRSFDGPKATGGPWPNKGTTQEALLGKDCLVKRDHDLREMIIQLKATAESTAGVIERCLEPVLVEVGVVPYETTFTVTNEWLMAAYKALDPFEMRQLQVVNGDDLQKLHSILCSHLEQHIVGALVTLKNMAIGVGMLSGKTSFECRL